MSGDGFTHWCHHCCRPFLIQSRTLNCPYCNGPYTQSLYEILGPNPEGFRVVMEPFHFLPDAFSSLAPPPGIGILPPLASSHYPFHGLDLPPFDYNHHGIPQTRPTHYSPDFSSGDHVSEESDFGDLTLTELMEEQLGSGNEGRGAPRSAIDAMPTVIITRTHLNTDANCPVCQDKFELGSEVKKMPCDHIYHKDCIVPWLLENNSCPVCRSELPLTGNNHRRRRRWNFFSFLSNSN